MLLSKLKLQRISLEKVTRYRKEQFRTREARVETLLSGGLRLERTQNVLYQPRHVEVQPY